ncbi:hypothetical protein HHL28_02260 [Aerophototrophica crusticola]|uniref:histidine kinase n=1 Tax=Aerophototrophica crusticola TaxID=1709002 RepID=A0A858R3W8_9PROT|nr:hypothetical protein HHL28_02260 [Rhodospirillaceae bacterium B3]
MDGENGKQGQGRAARLLLDSLDGYADPFVLCDPDDRVLYTNARYHELFPAAPPQGEIRGWGFEALLRRVLAGGETPDPGIPDPEEFIRLRLAQRAALAGRSLSEATIGGRLFRRVEERTPNGCVITSYSDITDLKQAQEAAERNAARLAAAVEAIPGGFMMMDEGLNYLVWNSRYPGIGGTTDAVIRSHGNVRETLWLQARRGDYDDLRLDPGAFTAGQVADTPCLATLLRCQAARPPGQRPTEEEMEAQVEWHLLRFRPGGRVDGDNAEREGTFRVAGSGAVIEFRRTYTPGLGWVSLYTDVTERMREAEETAAARAAAERALADLRAAQASLVQAEKLASLGGLVAGIAHELNTPIGITYTAATHLKDQAARFRARLEGGQLRRAELDEFLDLVAEGAALLEANAGRASQLVQSFKNVSADRTHDERRRFELGPALEELVVSLGPAGARPGTCSAWIARRG